MASIPAVKALEERHAARGLRVIGVTKAGGTEEERAEVAKVAAEHGMKAPSYLDVDGAWCSAAGIRFPPAFLILDREGRVAYRHVGELTTESSAYAEMSALVERL